MKDHPLHRHSILSRSCSLSVSLKVSDRTHGVEYAIRDITTYARKYKTSGKEIIYLNIGDPVRFDFKTPDHIKRALTDAVMRDENYYTDSEGLPELPTSNRAKGV